METQPSNERRDYGKEYYLATALLAPWSKKQEPREGADYSDGPDLDPDEVIRRPANPWAIIDKSTPKFKLKQEQETLPPPYKPKTV